MLSYLIHAGVPEVGPILSLRGVTPALALSLLALDGVHHGE